MKHLKWRYFLIVLPFAEAYQGAARYDYVNGTFQKLPFSTEGAVIGFFIGLVFSAILYWVGIGIRAVVRKLQRQNA